VSDTSSVNNASSTDDSAALEQAMDDTLSGIGTTAVMNEQAQLQQLREQFKQAMSDSDSDD
jgi:hypothetical protein